MKPKSFLFSNKSSAVIVAGLAIIFSLIMTVMFVALTLITSIDDKLKQVVYEHSQQVVLANKMIYLARERTMLLHKIVVTDDAFQRDENTLQISDLGGQFIKAREALLLRNLWPDELALLQQQGQFTQASIEVQRRILELGQQGRLQEAHELLINKAIVAQDQVINVLLQFADLQTVHNEKALEESSLAHDDTIELILMLTFLVAIVSLFIAIFVIRKITSINDNIRHNNQRLAITNNILNESIEDLNRVTEELRKSESQERAIRENMLDAVVTINGRGIIESCNPAAEKMFGYTAEELQGSNVNILMPEPYRSHHDQYVEAYEAGQSDTVIGMARDLAGQHKDGHVFPMDIGVTRLLLDNELLLVGIMRDVTVRKQAEDALKRSRDELESLVAQRTEELQSANRQLEQMASHDSLTSLPNRVLVTEHLKQMLAHARRSQKMLCVLFLDLDGFKQVNDVLGHDAGDRLLQEVALRLKTCLREEDVVARIGGDEFVVISSHLPDKQNAADFAGRIINAVSLPVDIDGQQAVVGVSIGISCFPLDSDGIEALIKFADQAMYEAKKTGKNKFCFYS